MIDTHVQALGISQRIPPVSITAADYAEKVSGLTSPGARASEMEHAIRHHISAHIDTDPVHYQRLSARRPWYTTKLHASLDDAAHRPAHQRRVPPTTPQALHDLVVELADTRSRSSSPGSTIFFRCGCSVLTWPHRDSIQACRWVDRLILVQAGLGPGCGGSVAAFEVAESFFLTSYFVGEGLERGAQLVDLGGSGAIRAVRRRRGR